jgi:hypothetical protein
LAAAPTKRRWPHPYAPTNVVSALDSRPQERARRSRPTSPEPKPTGQTDDRGSEDLYQDEFNEGRGDDLRRSLTAVESGSRRARVQRSHSAGIVHQRGGAPTQAMLAPALDAQEPGSLVWFGAHPESDPREGIGVRSDCHNSHRIRNPEPPSSRREGPRDAITLLAGRPRALGHERPRRHDRIDERDRLGQPSGADPRWSPSLPHGRRTQRLGCTAASDRP